MLSALAVMVWMAEACGVSVRSIVFEEEKKDGKQTALVRFAPLALPWRITEAELAVPFLEEAAPEAVGEAAAAPEAAATEADASEAAATDTAAEPGKDDDKGADDAAAAAVKDKLASKKPSLALASKPRKKLSPW